MSALSTWSDQLAPRGGSQVGPEKIHPFRDDRPGGELELLVLASDVAHCAGIDLASGALVRAWSTQSLDVGLRPYDVVAGTIDDSLDLLPDPTQPEAVMLVGSPTPVGRITGRRAERYLRPLVHPTGRPLLELYGPAVPFWQRTRDNPSIALVEPEGQAMIRRRGQAMSCWFRWRGAVIEMPCLDRRLRRAMTQTDRTAMATGKGHRLVVALAPPTEGHCHKVVAGVLPRP